jgi:hypothetical protein
LLVDKNSGCNIIYDVHVIVTHTGKIRNACNIPIQKPEGKRPLG